jgi:hypothetical protein
MALLRFTVPLGWRKRGVLVPETHTKRQATQHDCLPSFLGDGDN